MLYEVRIYDGNGNLTNIVPPADLEKRSTDYVRSQFTDRDREHLMSLEDDAQTSVRTTHYMMA